MKKNSFMQGALIATLAIICSKVIGLLYVIPFYPLIGEKGGALYGYAYSIYGLFLNISTAGIPFAISRITSEYNALNQQYLKEKSYKVGRYFICFLGLIAFLLLFLFAHNIAYLFIGNIKGGNTNEDVSFVIRVVSIALLVVPLLSVSRGYLQGQKYIAPSSISQVLEQFTRVIFLLLGSFLTIKVFKLSLTTAVGVSVFAATFGALCAYIYIFNKIHKYKGKLNRDAIETTEEKSVTSRMILNKILAYSIPFVLIDVVRSGYDFADLLTINKTMVSLGYKMGEAEAVISILSTWGMKLNSIIYAVATGVIISLIPNLTSSNILNDKEDIKRKINGALQALIFVILPMTVILSTLSTPVWTVFFGTSSELGPMVFSFSIYVALIVSIFNTTVSMLHSLSFSKMVIYTLIAGLGMKVIFNIPLMHAFDSIGIHAVYGVISATIIAYFIALILNLIYIKKKFEMNYKDTLNKISKMIFACAAMVIVVLLFQLIIPINITSRLMSLTACLLYGSIGAFTYLFILIKTNTVYEIFGRNIFKKILSKIKFKNTSNQ